MNIKKHKKNRLSQEEKNFLGKQLKRQKKHKGKPTGNRYNSQNTIEFIQEEKFLDPRIGSKKPIQLISLQEKNKENMIDLENELEKLENDPKLDYFLECLENNEELNKEDQKFVKETLNRIEFLYEKIGIIPEND